MADDAGALLVRSGLVSSSALEDARARVTEHGGTLGEQLVAADVVADDKLTDFYRQRLLVPQVNPNSLARLPAKIVALIPSEMAVELRAIPVSLDNDNNLTVAMSDPSDRRAVDEIAFFTGAYVVRAVATQMQIAWCLAHYYGHVTRLGQRLVKSDEPSTPRPKSITDQVRASRHRRIERGELGVDVRQLRAAQGPQQADAGPSDDETPRPRARTASGEIRTPAKRAPSSIPHATGDFDQIGEPEHSGPIITIEAQASVDSGPVISVDQALDSGPVISIEPAVDSGPVITVEADSGPVITIDGPSTEDITARRKPAPRPVPRRRKPAAPDPPELAARAGEVQLATGVSIRKIDFEEPSIMISDELERALHPAVSGELTVREVEDGPASNATADLEDNSTVVVREQIHDEKSEPILLERRRPSDGLASALPQPRRADTASGVIELEPKKAPRRTGHVTQVGIGIVPAATSPRSDGVPSNELEDQSTDVRPTRDDDATRLDTFAAPPADDYTSTSEELLAAPPSPYPSGPGSGQIALPPRSDARPQPSGRVRLDRVQRAPTRNDEDEEDELDAKSKPTMVMSSVELDAVIPGRSSDVIPAHLVQQAAEETDDDGWGPPGTTIPPPLLGAIPGAIEPPSGIIPLPDMDSAPLMVAPPSAPEPGARTHTVSEVGLARALDEATARVLDLIHTLDHTTDRDQVIAVLIAHLAESHHRAGFFAARNAELSLFAIMPRMTAVSAATLRLDRPSTLQDVVGTRLPYRGPMHDEASRVFLQATLGACPAELLLVPIAVRERTVGVLFGEHRMRHTFDDQLALAARAAGMALERIIKAKRG